METPTVRLTDEETKMVYEPSEDSFLLLDALELDLQRFEETKPCLCLEIGSGTGIISTALGLALKKISPLRCVAIDINLDACKITKRTSNDNSIDLDVVRMDLTEGINARNIFDLVVFNPPYVVTTSEEIKDDKIITRAWAGGKKGREVMDRLFPSIPKMLADNGAFYLLVLKENEPREILAIFEDLRMSGDIVAERKIRGEHLYVMRFTWIRAANEET